MNLAEIQLLSNDLSVLKNGMVVEFDIKADYTKHNNFPNCAMFPSFMLNKKTFSLTPVLNNVSRWGRYLILSFSSCTVMFKMSHGTKVLVSKGSLPNYGKHSVTSDDIACIVPMRNQATGDIVYFIYADPLKCGHISVYPASETPEEFAHLGLDIMDSSFCGSYLISESLKLLSTSQTATLKEFLMNTNIIAYVDNEIACEAMFYARLNPFLNVTHELHSSQAHKLSNFLITTYKNMIAHLKNEEGIFDPAPISSLYTVFERDICIACDTKIEQKMVDNKLTYWCPNCQKEETEDMFETNH